MPSVLDVFLYKTQDIIWKNCWTLNNCVQLKQVKQVKYYEKLEWMCNNGPLTKLLSSGETPNPSSNFWDPHVEDLCIPSTLDSLLIIYYST